MLRTTLRRIEVFVTAVEARGFRLCADQLGISQAGVSRQIKLLETELGYPLFARQAGCVGSLTEKGTAAYHEAKDLLAHAGRLRYGEEGPATLRHVSVNADPLLDAQLAKYIASFMSRSPLLDIDLHASSFESSIMALKSDEVDIIYFFSAGSVTEIDSILAWREPVSICARADHPIFARKITCLADLAGYPFVAPPRGSHFRRCVDEMLRQRGLGSYNAVVETTSSNLAREVVQNGMAISGVFTSILIEELERYNIRAINIPQLSLSLDVRRAMRPGFVPDRASLSLTDFIDKSHAVAARQLPS